MALSSANRSEWAPASSYGRAPPLHCTAATGQTGPIHFAPARLGAGARRGDMAWHGCRRSQGLHHHRAPAHPRSATPSRHYLLVRVRPRRRALQLAAARALSVQRYLTSSSVNWPDFCAVARALSAANASLIKSSWRFSAAIRFASNFFFWVSVEWLMRMRVIVLKRIRTALVRSRLPGPQRKARHACSCHADKACVSSSHK